MAKNIIYVTILFSILLICSGNSLNGAVSSRPPMGWNSRTLGCGINETLIQQLGDSLIRSGLAGKGYQYVKINDCWQGKRDEVSKNIT